MTFGRASVSLLLPARRGPATTVTARCDVAVKAGSRGEPVPKPVWEAPAAWGRLVEVASRRLATTPVPLLPPHFSNPGTITPIWCKAWAVLRYLLKVAVSLAVRLTDTAAVAPPAGWLTTACGPTGAGLDKLKVWLLVLLGGTLTGADLKSDFNPELFEPLPCKLEALPAAPLPTIPTNGASFSAVVFSEFFQELSSFPFPSLVESRGSYTGQLSFSFRYARPLSSLKPVTALGAGLF